MDKHQPNSKKRKSIITRVITTQAERRRRRRREREDCMCSKRRNDGIYTLWEWCTHKTLASMSSISYVKSKNLEIERFY